MEKTIDVAVAGLGMMGQMHLSCYRENPRANLVAVCDENAQKLAGQSKVEGNIANHSALDLSGLRATASLEELLADPQIQLVDLCLPTRAHADSAIAALRAGKHVLCEKPMAWSVEECDRVMAAQAASGKFVLIGHCLRFWPQYVRAGEILASGELGRPLYASFHRSSGAPTWSGWLMDGAQSGGVVLDMHVHDVDTALWWFGSPAKVEATGLVRDGLPLKVDATWTYDDGPLVQLHGGWDASALPFRMAFEVMCQAGTLSWDSALGETMSVFRGPDEEKIEFDGTLGYAPELDYFLSCIAQNQAPQRATPQTSRESVRLAREELRQIGFSAPDA